MGNIAYRQSLVFNQRSQLSQTIPQFHVERMLQKWMPIAQFKSQRNQRRIYGTIFVSLGATDDCQRTVMIRIAAINAASHLRSISVSDRSVTVLQESHVCMCCCLSALSLPCVLFALFYLYCFCLVCVFCLFSPSRSLSLSLYFFSLSLSLSLSLYLSLSLSLSLPFCHFLFLFFLCVVVFFFFFYPSPLYFGSFLLFFILLYLSLSISQYLHLSAHFLSQSPAIVSTVPCVFWQSHSHIHSFCFSIYIYIYMHLSLSHYIYIYLPVSLHFSLYIYIYTFIYLSRSLALIRLSLSLSFSPSLSLSLNLCISPSRSPSISMWTPKWSACVHTPPRQLSPKICVIFCLQSRQLRPFQRWKMFVCILVQQLGAGWSLTLQ